MFGVHMINCVLISDQNKRITTALNSFGIKTAAVIANTELDAPVCCHADCAALRIGDTLFCEKNNMQMLSKKGITSVPVEGVKSPYPSEVKLNAKVFGNSIFCNSNHIADEVRCFANENGYSIIHCNQGYAACSTFKINDNAAITDDESVFKALSDNGVDCLLVSRGSVSLDGYDFGFIGGCGGMISNDIAVFAGSLESHADGKRIIEFMNKFGVRTINLFDGSLIDFGGFVVLEE